MDFFNSIIKGYRNLLVILKSRAVHRGTAGLYRKAVEFLFRATATDLVNASCMQQPAALMQRQRRLIRAKEQFL
jgi:hypothetical protein